MKAERFDDYDNLELAVQRAQMRKLLEDQLRLFRQNGGEIKKLPEPTYDVLASRWKQRTKTWNRDAYKVTTLESAGVA